MFSIPYMDNPRRRRFIAWYKATYPEGAEGRTRFMRDTGANGYEALTKGRVSHFFDEKQPFGEGAAKNLALRLGLEEDFFLRDLSQAAYDAGVMLDSVSDPELRKNIYGLWSQVKDSLVQGYEISIVTGVRVGAPRAGSAPKPSRQAAK